MIRLGWSEFPLPLIQVNPPELSKFNQVIKMAYSNGVFSNSGQIHRECSEVMAKHVNANLEGYLSSSNTSALVACLLSLNVRGRHVVLSNFTFAATLHAVILAGGIPVLCDVTEDKLEMDLVNLKKLIYDRNLDIAAVLPTRVFGFINDMSELIQECHNQNIPVVIDAAASYPPSKEAWNFQNNAEFEVFSLHATKVFGIGEGGLIIGSAKSIENVRERANFGLDRGGSLCFTDGLNAKADEFTSARALARYSEYPSDVEKRQEFVEVYKSCFAEHPGVTYLQDTAHTVYSYFPVIFSSERTLLEFQEIINPFVTTRRYYFPTIHSGYKGQANIVVKNDLTISESISKRILCLPVYVSFENELKSHLEKLISMALRSSK